MLSTRPRPIWAGVLDGVMALEGRARLKSYQRGKLRLYFPTDVSRDSQFPFEADQEIVIRIDADAGEVVLSPADDTEEEEE